MPDIFQTITGGFFDSVNKDRLYNADQMNMPYKKIVSDGLFFEGGDGGNVFKVTSAGGMTVNVGPGNALIGGKWAENEDALPVEISGNTSESARVDSVILRLDANIETRAIGIVYRQGAAAAPALDTSNGIKEFRLANITVSVNAVAITDVNITDTRGTADCPWVSSIVTPSEAQLTAGVGAYIQQNPTALIPAVEDSVAEWLEEHPEATTSVSDGSLTYKKLVTGTLGFVTPEMYGAKGDGVTDDTQAIQSAIDSGKSVLFNKKTYVCGRVNISGNSVIIDGNFATVLHGANSGFVILEGAHDVAICNFHSVCTYEKDSSQETNAHIIVGSNSTSPDEEYFAYNITVQNCSFNGGVMGVAVTSAKNVVIDNCKFDGFVYKPEDLSGGYGILIQSCIDVSITNSEFSIGAYGRHDVYISVDQRKSVHVKNKNITIDRCKFDHSALVLDENNYYYSPNTVPVNVRATERITVSNSYFHSVTGAVNLFSPDGPIDGAVVENCLVNSPVYNSGAGEVRHVIGVAGTAENHIKADISGITVLNVPAAYTMFTAIRNCTVNIYSCNIGATDIVCYENCTPHVFDIITAITSNFMRFNGAGETKGFCRNITFLNGLSGNKYYFGSGSTASNDFYDTVQIRVKLPISADWTDWIALPNGMNPENCYCSGIGMLNSTGIRYGQGTYTESARIFAELSANGMRVYNSDSNYFDSYAYVCITPVPRLYI